MGEQVPYRLWDPSRFSSNASIPEPIATKGKTLHFTPYDLSVDSPIPGVPFPWPVHPSLGSSPQRPTLLRARALQRSIASTSQAGLTDTADAVKALADDPQTRLDRVQFSDHMITKFENYGRFSSANGDSKQRVDKANAEIKKTTIANLFRWYESRVASIEPIEVVGEMSVQDVVVDDFLKWMNFIIAVSGYDFPTRVVLNFIFLDVVFEYSHQC